MGTAASANERHRRHARGALALLEADVHFRVAKDFIARVKEKALGEEVLRSVTPGQQIVKIFHDELTTLLGGDASPLNLDNPARILMVGLNGAGKTTSSAKLARWLKKQGKAAATHRVRSSCVRQPSSSSRRLGGRSASVSSTRPEEKDVLEVVAKPRVVWLGRRRTTWRSTTPPAGRKSTRPLIEELRRLKDASSRRKSCSSADAATGQQAVSVADSFPRGTRT